jgi:hypothetical protein
MKLVATDVYFRLVAVDDYFRSFKGQSEQQWEEPQEASKKLEATSSQKVQDGATEAESMPTNIIYV